MSKFKNVPLLDEQHPTKGGLAGQELAIEKIDNRVRKVRGTPPAEEEHDVAEQDRGEAAVRAHPRRALRKDIRSSGATFGILQYMDTKNDYVGRLRRKAEAAYGRSVYEANKLMNRGESGEYPGVPAMGQRDKRQMRSSPGIKTRPETFE